MALLVTGSVVLALVLGFAAGFVTFRRTLQWCPVCGAGLRCIECACRRAAYGRAVEPAARAARTRQQQ